LPFAGAFTSGLTFCHQLLVAVPAQLALLSSKVKPGAGGMLDGTKWEQ